MQSFESIIDGKQVILLYEGDYKPCHLYVRYVDFDLVVLDDTFKNAKIASAFLEAKLLYGNARNFLEAHGIPKTSVLWDLNHSGPPGN